MRFSLLALVLLCALPVQAQMSGGPGGTPPDPGHYWKVTYSSQGTEAMDYIYGNPNNVMPWGPYPWTDTAGETAGGGGAGGQYSVDATTSGTVTATLTWIPAANNSNDPPPSKVYILKTAYAGWHLSGPPDPPSGGAASDGLGDLPVAPQSGVGQVSSGKKVVTRNGSSGTVTLDPVMLSANTPTYPGYLQWGYATAGASFSASIDDNERAVTISCPAVDINANGGSQYREPALTGPVIVNVRQPDGTLRGDTANYSGFGNGGTVLSYTAAPTGSWAAGSQYHWNSSLTGNSASGTWPNIYNFSVGEPYGPGIQNFDHIFISLYDAGDGAEATGNYYMHFHDPYEPASYPEDTSYPRKQTTQIDPDVPSWPTYSWHAEVNPDTGGIDSIAGPVSQASTFPYLGTEAQSWHIDAGLGISKEPIDAHFGGGYDHDIVNHTSGVSPAIPYFLPAGYQTWAVYRQDILRHKGHLDKYSVHGYTLTGVWYRDENKGTTHGIYYPYASTTENAHDPDPDWNQGS